MQRVLGVTLFLCRSHKRHIHYRNDSARAPDESWWCRFISQRQKRMRRLLVYQTSRTTTSIMGCLSPNCDVCEANDIPPWARVPNLQQKYMHSPFKISSVKKKRAVVRPLPNPRQFTCWLWKLCSSEKNQVKKVRKQTGVCVEKFKGSAKRVESACLLLINVFSDELVFADVIPNFLRVDLIKEGNLCVFKWTWLILLIAQIDSIQFTYLMHALTLIFLWISSLSDCVIVSQTNIFECVRNAVAFEDVAAEKVSIKLAENVCRRGDVVFRQFVYETRCKTKHPFRVVSIPL